MKKLTKDEFVLRAKEIHGDKYDYSLTNYVNSRTEVCIICPVHGEFWQRPDKHLFRHAGCKTCSRENRKTPICGVGINDYEDSIYIDGQMIQSYHIWQGIIYRCYSGSLHKRQPCYSDCSVCDEWLYFTNFKKWFDENYIEGWDIDKDLLIKGNKEYGPTTCCFVPPEINYMLTKSDKKRGEYPIGVTFHTPRNKFRAQMSIITQEKEKKKIHLGYFTSPEEAFQAYKKEKEAYFRRVANKWKDKIDKRAFEALYNYKIETTD